MGYLRNGVVVLRLMALRACPMERAGHLLLMLLSTRDVEDGKGVGVTFVAHELWTGLLSHLP